jgi:hypothetical protein
MFMKKPVAGCWLLVAGFAGLALFVPETSNDLAVTDF